MKHSFYVNAFVSFACSPEKRKEKHIYVIVAVVVHILLFVFSCRLCYKMEGMGE